MIDRYRQPNHVDQRVNYHDTLQVDIKDYAADQHYHVDRHRKQNRLLRTSGVIEGMEVTKNADSTGIEITPGIAVDHEGRLIILNDNAYYNNRDLSIGGDKFRLSLVGQRGVIGLFIAYYEKLAYAPSSSPNRGPADRWQEQPELELVTPGNKPRQERAINLATITLSVSGQIESIDSETKFSGISFSRSNLSLRPTTESRLSLTGSLSVSDALNASNLNVARDAVVGGILSFSGRNRQLLSFGNGNFGIGVQEDTQYFRTAKNFAWYQSGSHVSEALSPGDGGKLQMVLNAEGQLGIGTEEPKHALDVRGGISSPSINSIFVLPQEGKERWKHYATGFRWVTMIEREIELKSKCNVAIIANGHGRTPSEKAPATSAGEIACAVFINDEFQNKFLNGNYGFGMGFAATDYLLSKTSSVLWIPIQATACKTLEAGTHKISFRLRSDNRGQNRTAQINGPSMLILLMGAPQEDHLPSLT